MSDYYEPLMSAVTEFLNNPKAIDAHPNIIRQVGMLKNSLELVNTHKPIPHVFRAEDTKIYVTCAAMLRIAIDEVDDSNQSVDFRMEGLVKSILGTGYLTRENHEEEIQALLNDFRLTIHGLYGMAVEATFEPDTRNAAIVGTFLIRDLPAAEEALERLIDALDLDVLDDLTDTWYYLMHPDELCGWTGGPDDI